MIEVRLNLLNILDNIPDEEVIMEESTLEACYHIRALRAGIELRNVHFYVEGMYVNNSGQLFLEDYNIWICKDGWEYL